jgi:hypothetical protein
MARSIEPLVVGRVVGDVIDMFVPSVDLAVQYTSRQVNNRSPPLLISHTGERSTRWEESRTLASSSSLRLVNWFFVAQNIRQQGRNLVVSGYNRALQD